MCFSEKHEPHCDKTNPGADADAAHLKKGLYTMLFYVKKTYKFDFIIHSISQGDQYQRPKRIKKNAIRFGSIRFDSVQFGFFSEKTIGSC